MLRREDGFTLLEALVTTIVTGILLTAMMGSISSTMHWGNDVQERSVLQTEVRATVDRLAADLRQAYTGDDTAPITAAGPADITFTSPDRSTPLHLRRISYRLQNGAFERSVSDSLTTGGPPWTFGATAGPFVQQVGSVVNQAAFTYADDGGQPTTDPAAIHSVTITLSVATRDTRTRQFTYRTTVTIRAMR